MMMTMAVAIAMAITITITIITGIVIKGLIAYLRKISIMDITLRKRLKISWLEN